MRLTRREDFQDVYQQGRKIVLPELVLYYRPVPARGRFRPLKFGICVSRKLGSAVERNRMKRTIREAIRLTVPEMYRGYEVVVNSRSRCKDLAMPAVQEALREALKRARILRKPRTYTSAPRPRRFEPRDEPRGPRDRREPQPGNQAPRSQQRRFSTSYRVPDYAAWDGRGNREGYVAEYDTRTQFRRGSDENGLRDQPDRAERSDRPKRTGPRPRIKPSQLHGERRKPRRYEAPDDADVD